VEGRTDVLEKRAGFWRAMFVGCGLGSRKKFRQRALDETFFFLSFFFSAAAVVGHHSTLLLRLTVLLPPHLSRAAVVRSYSMNTAFRVTHKLRCAHKWLYLFVFIFIFLGFSAATDFAYARLSLYLWKLYNRER
jgi:hypothetical protein